MDPALKAQLEQLLAELLKNTQDAAAWAKAELPLLVQEKIAFGRAYETTYFIIVLAACIIVIPRLWNKWYPWKPADTEAKVLTTIPLGIVTIIAIVETMSSLRTTLLVWFAPRLYIVEWLVDLVKTATR